MTDELVLAGLVLLALSQKGKETVEQVQEQQPPRGGVIRLPPPPRRGPPAPQPTPRPAPAPAPAPRPAPPSPKPIVEPPIPLPSPRPEPKPIKPIPLPPPRRGWIPEIPVRPLPLPKPPKFKIPEVIRPGRLTEPQLPEWWKVKPGDMPLRKLPITFTQYWNKVLNDHRIRKIFKQCVGKDPYKYFKELWNQYQGKISVVKTGFDYSDILQKETGLKSEYAIAIKTPDETIYYELIIKEDGTIECKTDRVPASQA